MPFMIVLGLAGFVSALALRAAEPMVPLLSREFAVDIHAIALLSSAFTLPYALGQPFLGPFGDARGKERVIVLCLGILALALIGSALSTSYTVLFVFRVIAGLASGGIIPLSLALIGDRSPIDQRQIAISRYMVAVITGQILGAPISGLISDSFGWKAVFYFVGALVIFICALCYQSLHPEKVRPKSGISIREGYSRVLSNPKAVICYGSVFLEGICVFGFFPFVAAGLEANHMGGVREAGFVIGGLGIGGAIFTIFAGLLLTRFGRRDVMGIGGVLIFIAFTIAGLSISWQSQLAAFTGIGVGFYMLHSALQTEATELAPAARGSAVALHAFFFFMGQAMGPFVYGWALPAIGVVYTTMLAGITICCVAFVARFLLMRADRITLVASEINH